MQARQNMSEENIKGHIRLTQDIEAEAENLAQRLYPSRVVSFVEESFKIEHAKAVTAEAYISETQTKYIILAAFEFTAVAQNALLKLLEEPPRNIEFIIITASKSTLLPTVRSRLPILKADTTHSTVEIKLNFSNLDYGSVFHFLKEHSRVSKKEAKALVEAMFHKAVFVEGCRLTQEQLQNFEKAYRLIELNSRVQSVLAMLLMSFTERGK